jgi:hypothetical protein
MTAHWYYKYLPYYILERKLKKEDDFNCPTVKYIHDKEIKIVLLEVDKGVWIGANKKEWLLIRKEALEERIKSKQQELRWITNELSAMD